MIIGDGYRPLKGSKKYVPVEDAPYANPLEGVNVAYEILAGEILSEFGPEGATSSEIYQSILGPMGLNSTETVKILRGARAAGYLR